MPSIHYKPDIALAGCNPGVTRALGPLSCGISRSGGRKRRTQKGGSRCFVPPNPTPSSYWPAPLNPAPPNQVPPTPCQFPHYRPLVLSQFGGKKYLDEFHRTALNVIYVLRDFIEKPLIVGGGGSTEAIIATKIRARALDIEGKEQIVVEKFADAMEEIPITLARNVGMDTIDSLIELRRQHAKFTNGKFTWIGIDSVERKISEIFSKRIVEPAVVKEQII